MQTTDPRASNPTPQTAPTPRLDDRFISNIQGKDFVLYSGLLDLAHQKGLIKLEVETLQLPSAENHHTAICKATAVSDIGEIFTDVGDADPNNVTRKIAPHIIRMASTRAKARCLRDFCNIGMTCLEELADVDDLPGNGNSSRGNNNRAPRRSNSTPTNPTPTAAVTPPSTPQPSQTPTRSSDGASPKMSEAQRRAILNLGQRRGLSPDELENLAQQTCGVSLTNLTPQHAAQFIRTLQQTG